ncbi:MAG: ASCH domain-containing protein [Coriobacteriia bacterium]|nr:ASCH domain-containing protein [Coriobacteriia bacterium]
MQQVHSVESLWASFVSAHPEVVRPDDVYSAWHFCDNKSDADELVQLVVAGVKRATAGDLWSYEAEGELLPRPGDFNVITDWDGNAYCIIRTVSVEVVAFQDVNDQFASAEGEGDRSLKYWREAHWAAFGRSLTAIGREPSVDMPVVCEVFEVVFVG